MRISRVPASQVGTVEPPDVGWMAAVGVYVGVVLAGASVAVAAAAGVGGATIIGTLSSLFTCGLVIGALGAKHATGCSERIGRGLPWLATPFLAPFGFAVATAVVLLTGTADAAAIGTGVGAFLSGLLALALAGMARTRYARAMVTGEPLATIPWVRANQAMYTAGWGLGLLALSGIPVIVQNGPLHQRLSPHLILLGTGFLLMARSTHTSRSRADASSENDGSRRILPDRMRRSVFGNDFPVDREIDPMAMTNDLECYPEGIVLTQPMQRRFVPWTAITDVTLTERDLRLSRDRWFDVRCHRDAIDDPETMVETVRRARSGHRLAERERLTHSID